MYSKFALLYLIAIFAFFSLSIESVLAVSPQSISISVAPENPAPGEQVSISLSSYAADLDSVPISWFVNGRNTLSGIGKKSLSLTAPSLGAESVMLIKKDFPDGQL